MVRVRNHFIAALWHSAFVDLNIVHFSSTHELKVTLEDQEEADEYLGYLNLSLSITPFTEHEKDEVCVDQ